MTPQSWLDEAKRILERENAPRPLNPEDRCPTCDLPRRSGIHLTAEACWAQMEHQGTTCASPAEHHAFGRPYYE